MRPRNETVRLQIENNELYATNTEKIQQLRQVKFEQLELKYKIQGQEVIKHLLSRIHGVILMKQIQCPNLGSGCPSDQLVLRSSQERTSTYCQLK